MSGTMYDAIVVGARCAGSPTAVLLARKGHRVLLVDRHTFPSDIFRAHVVRSPGAQAATDRSYGVQLGLVSPEQVAGR